MAAAGPSNDPIVTTEEATKKRQQAQIIPLAKSVDIDPIDGNFTQGCAFSPDGLCVLTATAADHKLRLYNTPLNSDNAENDYPDPENGIVTKSLDDEEFKQKIHLWKTVLSYKEGDSVRGYAWYPHMNSYEPGSCVFLSTSKDQPLHLIDAYTGTLRCSYRPYNDKDELESATTLTFSPDGERIFASGFKTNRTIRVFHTKLPGKDCDIWNLGKTRRSSDGQKGMVSTIHFQQQSGNVFAVGTYSPGSIYLYDDRVSNGEPMGIILSGSCLVGHGKRFFKRKYRYLLEENGEDFISHAKMEWFQNTTRNGITQLQWSIDEHLLFSAGRRSNAVVAWDVRMLTGCSDNPISANTAYSRGGDTNQRLEFDLDPNGNRLFVGSCDKCVKIYDIKNGKKEMDEMGGFCDVVNGVSVINSKNGDGGLMVAVAVGARRFDEEEDYMLSTNDVSSSQNMMTLVPPGNLELYHIK